MAMTVERRPRPVPGYVSAYESKACRACGDHRSASIASLASTSLAFREPCAGDDPDLRAAIQDRAGIRNAGNDQSFSHQCRFPEQAPCAGPELAMMAVTLL
jgi:hypothetical protein